MASDLKDEKLEAILRSLVASNLKHKEIVCRDFLNYEWSLKTVDRGFSHIEIFRFN